MNNDLREGLRDGLPIGLGYFPVSFAFGILAVSGGLTWWQGTLLSLLNLTSAGQFAGLGIMTAGGGLMEMAVSQVVINLRYSLMSITLSQKADESITDWYPMIDFCLSDGTEGIVPFEATWLCIGKDNYEISNADAFWDLTSELVVKYTETERAEENK